MLYLCLLLLILAKICKFCEMDYGTNTVNCTTLAELNNLTFYDVQQLKVNCSEGTKNLGTLNLEKFQNLTKIDIHDCGLEVLPDIQGLEKLQILNISKNNISVVPWQLLPRSNLEIHLQQNPIDCNNCQNKWLKQTSSSSRESEWDSHLILGHSRSIFFDENLKTCTFDHCPKESINSNTPRTINTTLGSSLDIKCHVESPNEWTGNNEQTGSFIWPLQDSSHDEANLNVTHDKKEVRLHIENVTSQELGFVACTCLYCDSPVFDVIELRFEANISVSLDEDTHDSHLIVHGYPINDLNLTIFRYADNMTETHQIISDLRTSFFNDSLLVKYQRSLSHYFLKYFTIFVPVCSDCPHPHIHINGEYAFEVCSSQNCAFINGRVQSVPTPDTGLFWNTTPTPHDEHSIFKHILIVILFFLLFVLIATLFSTLHIKRELIKKGWELKSRRASRNTATTEETRLEETSLVYSRSISNYIIQHVPLIERSSLELKDTIGKGAFGEVHTAEWSERQCQVAVKMLHNVQMDAEMDKEAALLAHLDHPNVVKLFGICRWDTGQVVLVLEMMNLGDLKTYLRERTPRCNNYSQFPPALLTTELINVSKQVCTGLCYIANQNIVHRDLAARNCLVSGETDMKICSAAFRPPINVKISDFGMSRRLYSDVEYYRMQDKKTALPVRWLPPECLSSGKFTHMSDMWSFGVCLFEIFSYGGVPFGDLSNSEVVSALITGVLPNVPSNCPQVIKEIIDDCWKKEPEERINAFQALDRLQSLQ